MKREKSVAQNTCHVFNIYTVCASPAISERPWFQGLSFVCRTINDSHKLFCNINFILILLTSQFPQSFLSPFSSPLKLSTLCLIELNLNRKGGDFFIIFKKYHPFAILGFFEWRKKERKIHFLMYVFFRPQTQSTIDESFVVLN